MLGRALVIVFVALLTGCATRSLPDELARRGATYDRCPKIVIVGSEADFGPIEVTLTEQPEIQRIWTTILSSRRYQVWYASGYRRLDLYAAEDAETPAAILWVNASGAAHVEPGEGQRLDRFYCPGLHDLLMRYLEAEHTRGGCPLAALDRRRPQGG